MMRVLTLATLFPNAAQPNLGVFVERQTLGLAAREGVAVEVAAPVGLPVWPLAAHRHYAPRRALAGREQWKGLTVHRPRYRVWPKIGQAGAAEAIARAVLPLARAGKFDVIDAEFFWPDGPAAMRLGQALGIPFSVKARGSDIYHWGHVPGIGAQIVEAGRAAGGLLAVSDALKGDMAALGIPAEKIRVHHTGVDTARFHPGDRAAAKAALGVEGPVIVTAGALIARKGQSLAIAALEQVPGATLLLVGEGPDRAALERQAAALGGRVRFLGARPHDELPAILAAADVSLQPSSAEGIANVWVEALACGVPVVTCDVGGARDAVDRPEAGRIAARDPAALAAAVRELLGDPPEPEKVARAAAKFSWEKNARELHEHLLGIVGTAWTTAA